MSASTQLATARRALRSGDPHGCGKALASLEDALEASPPGHDEAKRLLSGLAELADLTRAALEGVARARQHLAATIAEADHPGVYDSDGRREARPLRPQSSRRY